MTERSRGALLARFEKATAELEPPFALIDMDAFWSNATDLRDRAGGKPIRLASKSLRCRSLQEAVLDSDGFRGTLCFTLPEALWLASHGADDLLVAYPTVDRRALATLSMVEGTRITVMIDSIEHLEHIDAAVSEKPNDIRVCIDIDAGFHVLGGRIKLGAKRSPLHTPADAVTLAQEVVRRPGFQLAGIMAYEAQIAGIGDAPPGQPLRGAAVRMMQSRSAAELRDRRAAIVEAVRGVAPLEFVNAGGTGSLAASAREEAVTEVTAGSGLYAPLLFDTYTSFDPIPAAFFALPVVRKPSADTVSLLGGGYLASGPGDKTRLPQPWLPDGLKLTAQEGAGEVQTPITGEAARYLHVGDRVYLRHAKAGELCERFGALLLVEGDAVIDEVRTYRGEGQHFL